MAIAYEGCIGTFAGLKIVETPMATEPDGYNFKQSTNPSARVTKKLLKRFGSWERRKPAIYQRGDILFCHPALAAEMRRIHKP